MLPPTVAAQGACTKPGMLPLVDAAFKRQGGEAQERLAREACSKCPIWRECLDDAVENGEYGPWGGTNARARNRYVPTRSLYNMRNVIHPSTGRTANALPTPGSRPRDPRAAQLRELGVTSQDVKRWAVDQGLISRISKGWASVALIERYAAAHTDRKRAP